MKYGDSKTLVNLIDLGLKLDPNKVCINDGDKAFSFKEVKDASDRFARYLVSSGVEKGDRVLVIAEKTANLLPIALSIWKSGAVYTPIDIELPEDRLASVVENIEPSCIVCPSEQAAKLVVKIGCDYINYADKMQMLDNYRFALPDVMADDAAIIIHTSGSTGLPKGVVLEHKSVVAYFDSHSQVFNLSESSRCFNTASFHYDVSVQDTFMPIYKGGYVYVNRNIYMPSIILPIIKNEKITHLTAVSTVLSLITGEKGNIKDYGIDKLQSISTGAEVCDPGLIHAWMESVDGLVVVNGYGPSEVNSATVSYVIRDLDKGRQAYYPIGKTHANVLAQLIDENDEIISEPDKIGQLVLGGPQLMREYWKNPVATRKAFITINGDKYYKTGDLCTYDNDMNYVFHGRNDFEVKISGRRINLLEISETINQTGKYYNAHAGVIECDETKQIYSAFCTKDKVDAKEIDALRDTLLRKFPLYMIPKYFAVLQAEKVTSAGKANNKFIKEMLGKALNDHDEYLFEYDECQEKFMPLR